MALAPGTRLGPFEIVSPLGIGGMGEVYRATDTNLKRQVAIKVLPASVAADAERLARFQREAEVLAALNHPNIAHIHGLEKQAEMVALVMELVEGPTLADRIAQGAIALADALPIAKQIAEALEGAHEQGIIHRDLKPANIKVRDDGTVKVLDFGLAKALAPGGVGATAELSMSPTITTPAMTQAGMILGTAAYMSPEQAKGRTADKRSDVWAFGCVLYEMLTGARAFAGEDVSDTLAAVLRSDPDWARLPADTPASIQKLMRRCLEKDRKHRLDSAADARLEIEEALTAPRAEPTAERAPTRPPVWRRVLPWSFAGATAIALAVVLIMATPWRAAVDTSATVRFQIPAPGATPAEMFTFSPDGRHLAYVATVAGQPQQLWVRDLDTLEPRVLQGTDGAAFPFWSPDGRSLGFFAQAKLKKIAIAGGPAQTLCDAASGRGGSWNRDGVIVFSGSPTGLLSRVSSAGGAPVAVTTIAPGSNAGHRFPVFLPDGIHVVYTAGSEKPESAGVFVTALDGGAPTRLLPDVTNALYAPPSDPGGAGHLVFRRENTLMVQPFDTKALQLTGEMSPLAAQVPTSGGTTGYGAFSLSDTGVLAYRTGGDAAGILTWIDRSGKRLGTVGKPGVYRQPSLSPDNTTVAASMSTPGGQADIWLQDLGRDVGSRFTFRSGSNRDPVWSPDGSRLAFDSYVTSGYSTDIYIKAVAGTGQEQSLLHLGISAWTTDWSPDGKWILFHYGREKTAVDLWLLPVDGVDHKPVAYLQTPFSELNGVFSPDGRWIAYESNESGQSQIYVQSNPTGGAKYQISSAGGTLPRWRRDGKELFYLTQDFTLMAVPMTLGDRLDAGTSGPLFTAAGMVAYSPARDGQRFLANVPAGGEGVSAPPITVVLNWATGRKQ